MPQSRDMASLKRRYLLDINLYERTYDKWDKRGTQIVKRYRDERSQTQQGTDNRYNILWSNVQTILPAVFARLPKPEVSRRYKDKDPIGRVASLMLERALEYEIEQYPDYASAVGNSVEDRLLPGRGISWVRYEPAFKPVPETLTDDVQKEVIDYECAPVDYVAWQDFGHNVARTWEEVYLIWRKVPLDRDELIARFGKEIGSQVALDQKSEIEDKEALASPEADSLKKATIYEIWDKKKSLVIWLSKSFDRALDVKDDPLHLDGFFPCPRPLYATTTTNTLVPVPDYALYQDQAKELDLICERIDLLVSAIKVAGVYDAAQKSIQRMLDSNTGNILIPVDNWAMFAEKGGVKGVIDFMPLDMIYKALEGLYVAREQAKAVIYEITGISDIIRGASDPNETLGAQELKGQFASKRLKKLQDSVSRFATDILKIKAEIICKHYQPESIKAISGANQLAPQDLPLVDQAIALLRDDVMSNFRIEVSSDSLIEVDEQQEKQNRMEFITAIGGFLEKAIQAPPILAPLLGEVLLYGVRAFKAGKTLEGTIEETLEKLKEQAAQPQQTPPDPEVVKAQLQQQLEQQKMQFEQQKFQMEQHAEGVRNQMESQRAQQELEMQRQTEMMKSEMQKETELKKAEIQASAQITIAQINAGMKAATTVATSQAEGDAEGEGATEGAKEPLTLEGLNAVIQDIFTKVHEMAEESMSPTEIGRGPDGKVTSIKRGKRVMNVSYGPDGRMSGVK